MMPKEKFTQGLLERMRLVKRKKDLEAYREKGIQKAFTEYSQERYQRKLAAKAKRKKKKQ